ncbi:MAG: hypothetical protein L6264_09400 [Weeksellaceae bacterium]|nr:hypothetical protein [Bacteroidota bacterium]MCG2781153.1 hypothetical protein [Weeksellaceae bacterium]
MATIITGLFNSQSQSKKISEDLEHAGFPDSDYIVYLHTEPIHEEKTSIWRSFFKNEPTLEDDSLAVSVKVNEQQSIEKVNHVFAENAVIHQNLIENIEFKDAESLDYIKKIVALRARSEIYSSPEVKHHDPHSGMTSEVDFSKDE